MPRSRSAVAKKANPSWEGIEVILPKEFLAKTQRVETFFEKHLACRAVLEIEIGSGAGHFLMAAAPQKPNHFFVGIEYSKRFIKLIRDRLIDLGVKNVLLVATDAKFFVRDILPACSVDAFHVYFPDPWPKRSQHHKRSLSLEGLLTLQSKLKKGGKIFFATDHQGYFENVEKSLSKSVKLKLQNRRVIEKSPIADFENPNYLAYGGHTQFGKKYLAQGKKIFVLELRN